MRWQAGIFLINKEELRVFLKGGCYFEEQVLKHSVMIPRAWPRTHLPNTHRHTQSRSWCKTVHRAQFGTAELLCLSRVMTQLSLKSERPSAPAQLELP